MLLRNSAAAPVLNSGCIHCRSCSMTLFNGKWSFRYVAMVFRHSQWMGSFRYFRDSLWSISSVDRTAQWPVGKLVPDTAIDYWQVSRKIYYQHIPPSLLLAPVDNPPFGPMTVWTTDKHPSQNVLCQMAVPQPLFEKLYARDAECKFPSLSMVGTARILSRRRKAMLTAGPSIRITEWTAITYCHCNFLALLCNL